MKYYINFINWISSHSSFDCISEIDKIFPDFINNYKANWKNVHLQLEMKTNIDFDINKKKK